MLATHDAVKITAAGVTLTLPAATPTDIDRWIVLTLPIRTP